MKKEYGQYMHLWFKKIQDVRMHVFHCHINQTHRSKVWEIIRTTSVFSFIGCQPTLPISRKWDVQVTCAICTITKVVMVSLRSG